MIIRIADPDDLPKWLEVAKDAGPVMKVADMDANTAFLEYARRKLEQKNAILAWDESNEECAGVVGFSLHNNSVTWLAVKGRYRNQGIGSKLLSSAISKLNVKERITVNTYPGTYEPGQPARRLYLKQGFIETISEPFIIDGLEMVELTLLPKQLK